MRQSPIAEIVGGKRAAIWLALSGMALALAVLSSPQPLAAIDLAIEPAVLLTTGCGEQDSSLFLTGNPTAGRVDELENNETLDSDPEAELTDAIYPGVSSVLRHDSRGAFPDQTVLLDPSKQRGPPSIPLQS